MANLPIDFTENPDGLMVSQRKFIYVDKIEIDDDLMTFLQNYDFGNFMDGPLTGESINDNFFFLNEKDSLHRVIPRASLKYLLFLFAFQTESNFIEKMGASVEIFNMALMEIRKIEYGARKKHYIVKVDPFKFILEDRIKISSLSSVIRGDLERLREFNENILKTLLFVKRTKTVQDYRKLLVPPSPVVKSAIKNG